MPERRSLLAVFAHPDDESIVAGGTFLRYAQEGVRTALICATRGEWGPISDDKLADYSNLGEIRESELRAACEVLKIGWLKFLDLHDGSVAAVVGSQEELSTLEKIVRAIREIRPQTVITFGPDGLYGHDDHIAIGRFTTQACLMADDVESFPHHQAEGLNPHQVSNLYYSTWPRGMANQMLERIDGGGQVTHLWGIPPEQFGIPSEKITAAINVSQYVELKLAALRCHRTQLDANHIFTAITSDLAHEFLGTEYFRSAFSDDTSTQIETDLFTMPKEREHAHDTK